MSTQVGRISGPLLKSNLLRNGVDLAFESDLLYIDVVNHRVGINTSSPTRNLDINGPIKSNGLIIDNSITIGNVILSNGANISTITGPLNLVAPSNIQVNRLAGGHIRINDHIIHNDTSNEDLELRPNGTGKVSLDKDLNVYGSIHSTGDVTFDNNVIFGDDSTQDTIVFNGRIENSLFPTLNNAYSIGTNTRKWNNIYLNDISNYSSINAQQDIIINGTSYGIIQGKIWYVAKNGNPSNVGNHPNAPFDSLQLALSRASAGDTVYVFPGTYYETFPLTVPTGVSIKGTNLRDCLVNPSPSTTNKDAFLLNSDVSISDITIQNFYFDAVNNTGYAFKLASGFNFNTKSPYITNVSVITQGSVTSGLDPRGFNSHDAGKGAYIDGSVANINSAEVSIGMNKVNFITPGVDSITAINGVILNLQNIFTYFANKGYYVTLGSGRNRQATLTIPNNINLASTTSNTFFNCTKRAWEQSGYKIGSTLSNPTYFPANTSVTNVQGPYNNYGISYYKVTIDKNPLANFTANTNFVVTGLIYNSIIRSFNSSSSYGLYSAHANGSTSSIFLNNHIFHYVGSGLDSSNDYTLIANNNGIYETNSGTVAYVGLNQSGSFGVGNNFYIDSLNLTTSINWAANNNINNIIVVDNTGLIFSTVNKTQITTGNLVFSGNTVSATTGNLNFLASSGKTYLQQNVAANTNINISNDFIIKGNIRIGDQTSDTVVINPKLDQDINPDINNTYNLGSSNKSWLNLWARDAHISNIELKNSSITASLTNADLNLTRNGTGLINIESISFSSNIFNNDDLYISSGNNSVKINSNTALKIPTNISSSILNPIFLGGLIYETDTKFYTGASTSRLTLGGVYSSSRNDYIQLDSSNQQINFKNNNLTTVTVTPSTVIAEAVNIGNIFLQNNAFTSVNNNFTLTGNGTGSINFNNKIKFTYDNKINNLTNLPLIFSNVSGDGYLKFNNLRGLSIPSGNTVTRETTPEVGTTRFNSDLDYIEVWNGTQWTVSTGGNFATLEEIDDLADIYTLILG